MTHLSRTTHGIAYDTTQRRDHRAQSAGGRGRDLPRRRRPERKRRCAPSRAPAPDCRGRRPSPSTRRTTRSSSATPAIAACSCIKRDADGDAKPAPRRFRAPRRSCCRSSASRSIRCATCSSSRPTRACPAASPVCSSSGAPTTATSRRSASLRVRKPASRGCARSGSIRPPAGSSSAAINNEYLPPYDIDKPRAGLPADVDLPSPWNTGTRRIHRRLER